MLARLSSRNMFFKKSGQAYFPSRVLITENDVKSRSLTFHMTEQEKSTITTSLLFIS